MATETITTTDVTTSAEIEEFSVNAVLDTVNISEETVVSTEWGKIGGKLSDQEDLQSALDDKVDQTAYEEALQSKVDKEDGKSLSTNDYTDADKALVDTIANKADKSDLPTALSDLTDDLPKDTTPTEGSDSYVTSGTVYTALADKLDKSNPTGSGSLTLGRHPSGDASTYVARFGNGTSDDDTSNAMALDYNGNATFTGNVTDGSGNVLSKKINGTSMTQDEYDAIETKETDMYYFIVEE